MNRLIGTLLLAVLAGCGSAPPAPVVRDAGEAAPPHPTSRPAPAVTKTMQPPSEAEGRAFVQRYLPERQADRPGWAKDIHNALVFLGIPLTAQNVCAVIALAEQESGLVADPAVPNLNQIAFAEIERRRAALGVPKLAVQAALNINSSNGVPYGARIKAVRTEKELSEIFEDFIANVPFGKKLFGHLNPVKTAGAMQVGIAFAEEQAGQRPYPYKPIKSSIRNEVFTRRGGLYFGTAYLLDYPAGYPEYLYRFADFNAGRHASRNAAFQQAVAIVTRKKLALDGDLLAYGGRTPAKERSETARAIHAAAARLSLSPATIDADLAQEKTPAFEQTRTYRNVFTLAEDIAQRRLPRAILPQIALSSPKIQRKLTTAWFAERVNGRFNGCLGR